MKIVLKVHKRKCAKTKNSATNTCTSCQSAH